MMTYLDLLKIEHPDALDKSYYGGCCGCPGNYWDGAPHRDNCGRNPSPMNCAHCWYSEVPNSIPAPRVQFNINEMQKGEKEMEPRNISLSPTASMANNPRKPSICQEMQELRKLLAEIHCKTEDLSSLLFAGEEQNSSSSCAPTPSCLADDVHMTKEIAMAVMDKLVTIQEKL
jgi:hypothetical protein